jgi:hypothetical protein
VGVFVLKPTHNPWKATQESANWHQTVRACTTGTVVSMRIYERAYHNGLKFNCLLYPGRKRNNYTVYYEDMDGSLTLGFVRRFLLVVTMHRGARREFALAELIPFGKCIGQCSHWKMFDDCNDGNAVSIAPVNSFTSRVVCVRVASGGVSKLWVTKYLRDFNRESSQVPKIPLHCQLLSEYNS